MDTIGPQARSAVMAKVKSRGNKSTEWRLRAWLIREGIRGWRVLPAGFPGAPDFVFDAERVAVFTDGCFWHGCERCRNKRPSSNTSYWDRKIERNRRRDRAVSSQLRRGGWRVVRIWEHDLRCRERVLRRIRRALSRTPA